MKRCKGEEDEGKGGEYKRWRLKKEVRKKRKKKRPWRERESLWRIWSLEKDLGNRE